MKIICELLKLGKTVKDIKEMEKLDSSNINLEVNIFSYPLYYLLINMPSGLPDCFLKLIFDNYGYIIDDKNLIIKSFENNWNLIDKNKISYENLNANKNIEVCFKYLFKTLKLYTKLLIYFIEKNKEKINNRNGNIHYIFNSYSKRNIWKCKIPNIIDLELGKNILNKDFNIEKHKQNIMNTISLIISKIDIFRKLNQVKEEIDVYLENILLLFPSYFFLERDNVNLLEKCIDFCNELITKTKIEYLKENEKKLKLRLLLFLYSINENKKDILEYNDVEHELKVEIGFLREIRRKNIQIYKLNELIKRNISEEMNYYLYREIAIKYYKEGNYEKCLNYLKQNINSVDIYNKQRAIIDYCYVFKNKFNRDNCDYSDYRIKSKDNFKLIKKQIKNLNMIMKDPLQKDIYFEAYKLRKKIYDLLKPDIIMLNSNSLKNISLNIHPLNNQHYILKELHKNIHSHIRIKYNVLNNDNLNLAFNDSGEILIVQSDDFTEFGDIICESKKGESYIFSKIKEFFLNYKGKKLDYKIIILCFHNSSLLEKYFDNIDYQYLITFEYFDNSQCNVMREYNKLIINFLLDFIKNTINNSSNIEIIFNTCKIKFEAYIKEINNIINIDEYIKLSKKNIISSKIDYHEEIDENNAFFYDTILKLDDIDINEDSYKYFSEVYNLIQKINYANYEIFYSNKSSKKISLKISLEAMKFFHRHKIYCEYFYVDMIKCGKKFLKSLIKKINKLKEDKNEKIENYNEDENTRLKFCFVLINNCTKLDLLDINIYSILNDNSSFIIIYDEEKYLKSDRPNEMGNKEGYSFYENVNIKNKGNFMDVYYEGNDPKNLKNDSEYYYI